MDAHIWQLITAICAPHSTDLHVSHFDESHNVDLRKNELQWFLFAAGDKTLGMPCIYNAVEGHCDLVASRFLRVGDDMFDVTLTSFVAIVVVGSVHAGAVIALAFHACTHG